MPEQWEQLRAQAADPNSQAYINPATGQIEIYAAGQTPSAARGLRPATPEDVEKRASILEHSTTGQTALAVGEATLSGATLGLVEGDAARREALESTPGGALASQTALVAGTLGPAILTGGLAGGAAGAVGLGRLGVGAATLAGQEVGQALAQESAEAARQDRAFEAGNLAQNLMYNAAFLGAGRLVGRVVGREARAVEQGIEAAADSPASALAQARTAAKQTRQKMGGTPSRAEATAYARQADEVHYQTNELAGEAGDSLLGRDGSFQAAHGIHLKKTDVAGKMNDADGVRVDSVAKDYEERLRVLAEDIASAEATSAPSNAAKKSLIAVADELNTVYRTTDVEDIAIALDRTKRHLDNLREKFGGHHTKATDPLRSNIKMIDDVVEPLRRQLEDSGTFGKHWAEKQMGENRLWAGRDGIIENRAIWQDKLMTRLPGAAGKVRTEFGTVPAFKVRGDMVESLLKMNARERRQVLDAFDKDMAATDAMTQLKLQAAEGQARNAIFKTRADVDHMRTALEEAKRIVAMHEVHGKSIEALQKGGDAVESALSATGAGLGGAFGGIPGAMAGGVAGRAARRIYAERFAPVGKQAERMSREQLLERVAARRAERAAGKFSASAESQMGSAVKSAASAAKRVPGAIKDQAIESALATGGAAGALALTAAATESLDELDRTAKQIREHAMVGLVVPDAKPFEPLPGISERFRGDAPTVEAAYEAKVAQLRQLAENPHQFVDRMTKAFGSLTRSGHAYTAMQMTARVRTGVDYLMTNLPPSVAQSMFRPNGSPPDRLAILKFAQLWEGTWFPMDVVQELSTLSATPTQMKAVRDVHPDLYSGVLLDVIRTVSQTGTKVPFETRRYLDAIFNLGAAAGPSFSQGMINLLALARQNNQPSGASLSGESVVAPSTPTAGFSKGPTSIQP